MKCFFISSQATTKEQSGIKQSGGMLRPSENALETGGTGMLKAGIMEQRDVAMGSAAPEPDSSCFYLHRVGAGVTSQVQKMRGDARSFPKQELGTNA